MTIEFTPEQQQITIDALRDRISKLFNMAEAYKDGGNKIAQMDCIDEMRRVKKLLDYVSRGVH